MPFLTNYAGSYVGELSLITALTESFFKIGIYYFGFISLF